VSGVLLVQGANMEYLGHREPEVYGTTTAAELDALLEREARLRGIELEIRYTNVEGEAIDLVYAAVRAGVDGLVMNPAGFLHAGPAFGHCRGGGNDHRPWRRFLRARPRCPRAGPGA
jgi:3-dehydroquinate dehydratase-2